LYFGAIHKLKEKIQELEDIQVEMIKLFLLNTDNKKVRDYTQCMKLHEHKKVG